MSGVNFRYVYFSLLDYFVSLPLDGADMKLQQRNFIQDLFYFIQEIIIQDLYNNFYLF